MALLSDDHVARRVAGFSRDHAFVGLADPDEASTRRWFREQVPLFECSDPELEDVYYFRWWSYRKHLRRTPAGWVVTEFLPDVCWAGVHNTIGLTACHHLYEGRWLREGAAMDDYTRFWLGGGGAPHMYSSWLADAVYARYLVTGDAGLPRELLGRLVGYFDEWERGWEPTHSISPFWQDGKGRLAENGLFWQVDSGCDGMEFSIGGGGYRPTLNSYLYGDAMAISRLAALAGDAALAERFSRRGADLKRRVQSLLWDPDAKFFKTRCEENANRYELCPWYGPRRGNAPTYEPGELVDVREQIGFIPWYFNLPDPGYEEAWRQLRDPHGFAAPFGPTTAERRHPKFMYEVDHMCLWNGPSWPFATSQTLVALGNLLNGYEQAIVGPGDYLDLLRSYARSHRLRLPDGRDIRWIDEDLDPDTGEWLARKILYAHNASDKDRGACYNHSTYADLIITGLAGLRPRPDSMVEVMPLVPPGALDYFCLEGVRYHGCELTIGYDRTGRRYGQGAGVFILAGGDRIGRGELGTRLTASL